MAAGTSAKIHKWLALLLTVPILFWFVSGLFFAAVPIERVRSEHRIADVRPVAISLAEAAAGLERIARLGAAAGERIELRSVAGRPVAMVASGEDRPRLYDLASGRLLSPIAPSLAREIAALDASGDAKIVGVTAIDDNSPEYRGPLPAWRVDFDDGADRSLYVAADTGAVTARRSTLWRVYDFLWSLHILDFDEHEDFNTPLLIVAAALALVVIVTGIIMFPSRLGYSAWRRRRRGRREV